jgi:hypothetical protein
LTSRNPRPEILAGHSSIDSGMKDGHLIALAT